MESIDWSFAAFLAVVVIGLTISGVAAYRYLDSPAGKKVDMRTDSKRVRMTADELGSIWRNPLPTFVTDDVCHALGWLCAAAAIACAGFEISGAHAVAVACAMLALATFVATLTIAAMVRP